MAKKLFWKNQMLSEDVNSYLVSGKYVDENGKVAEIHDGALVVVGDFINHAYYEGVKDLSCRTLTAPEAPTDEIVIVDLAERSHGEVMGVDYRIGRKTAGMTAIAGIPVRCRKLAKIDSFIIGAGNINGEAVVGEYLVPEGSGSTLFVPSVEKATEGICVKVETDMPLTEGVIDTDVKYLCTVVNA
jgi:hypothetical protein